MEFPVVKYSDWSIITKYRVYYSNKHIENIKENEIQIKDYNLSESEIKKNNWMIKLFVEGISNKTQ